MKLHKTLFSSEEVILKGGEAGYEEPIATWSLFGHRADLFGCADGGVWSVGNRY